MKSFVSSLLLFSLMLGGIFLNSRYLARLSSEMRDTAEALPPISDETSDDAFRTAQFERLTRLWQKHRDAVSLTVTMRMVEGIDDCLGALEAAIRYDSAEEFDVAREHLLRIIRDLGYYDALQLGSVL